MTEGYPLRPHGYRGAFGPARSKTRRTTDQYQNYKIAKIEKRIRHLAPEPKYFDIEFSSQPITWGGNLIDVTSFIAQGTTDVTRVGDQLMVQKLDFRCQVQQNAATLTRFNQNTISLGFLIEKSNAGSSLGQMFDNNNSIYAALNLKDNDRRHMYTYKKNKMFTLDNIGKTTFAYSKSIKCNTKVSYLAASTTVLTNAIKFYYIGSGAGSPTENPNITFVIRVHYTDV